MRDSVAQKLRSWETQTRVERLTCDSGSFDAIASTRFNATFPAHFHDFYSIGVMETGAHWVRTPAGSWRTHAGAILAFAAGEPHAARLVSSDGISYRMLYPSAATLRASGLLDSQSARSFCAPVIDDPEASQELLRATQPLLEGDLPRTDAVVAALRKVLQRYSVVDRTADSPGSRFERVHVHAIRAYLAAHLADRVKLADVAAEFGVNMYHMAREFRRAVGLSPHAYLVQLRVNRAQAMLAAGSTVAEATYRCGFCDQAHMTRLFKRTVGIPPAAYRSSVQPGA